MSDAPLPSGTEDTALAPEARSGETPPSRPSLSPGEIIGRYEIVALRGQGGMGEVYRARDRRLGRDVALKMVRKDPGVACGVMCTLLMREAQTLARLTDPGLVAVHDVGEHKGCVYLAMEYVDGVTLREWAANQPWRARLDALARVGRALACAHGAGVVHRDVKPENVLVDGGGRVVLTDFGIARSLADIEPSDEAACGCARDAEARVLDDTRAGSPPYMAPEQYEGKAVDVRADQFAFAVTAWDTLYGSLPFSGATLREMIDAVYAQRIAAVPENTEVPPAVADVLRRAMRVAASARYPSMTALVNKVVAASGLA